MHNECSSTTETLEGSVAQAGPHQQEVSRDDRSISLPVFGRGAIFLALLVRLVQTGLCPRRVLDWRIIVHWAGVQAEWRVVAQVGWFMRSQQQRLLVHWCRGAIHRQLWPLSGGLRAVHHRWIWQYQRRLWGLACYLLKKEKKQLCLVSGATRPHLESPNNTFEIYINHNRWGLNRHF